MSVRRVLFLSSLLLAAFSAAGQETGDDQAGQKENEKPAEKGMVSRATSAVVKTSVAMSQAVSQRVHDEALRMRDFFDVQLPGALSKHSLVLDLEPKAGDLLRREFVRFPMELRYGMASNWEATLGFTPVMPNPIDTGEDHRWGMGLAKLGIRHDTTAHDFIFPRISYGIESQIPLGEPPVDLIDHYVHVKPYVTASRPLESWHGASVFVALSYDRSITCPDRENVPEEVVRRNITEIAPGLLYKPGEYGAFVQYALRFQQEPNGSRLVHQGKIGVIWDMPLDKSRRWHMPGKWQFELGYKITDEEGYQADHGIHARVKWRTDLFRSKKKPVSRDEIP
jgi:hypothetical protein